MSLADFLFTPSLQRVLGATLLQPDRSFTLQELLRLANSGRGSAQKQVDRLVEAGVLQEDSRRGRQRSIRANTEFILYPELLSIARKSFAVAEPLKEALEPFAEHITSAFVFGSVAKGTDSGRSDIDLIVVCGGDAQQKRDLRNWLEGWSLCLAEVSFQLYGLPSSGLLDIRFLEPDQARSEISSFTAAGKTLQALPVGTAPAPDQWL